jgi:hypothetical protein
MNIVNIKGGRWLKQPTQTNRLSSQSRVVARLCNGFFIGIASYVQILAQSHFNTPKLA